MELTKQPKVIFVTNTPDAARHLRHILHIEIDHIDINENPYSREKQEIAQRDIKEYHDLIDKYRNGELDVYYEDKI